MKNEVHDNCLTESKVNTVGRPKNLSFSLIAAIIGLMVAIQFQTVREPEVRDTRDTWQLREDLLKEKEIQSKLLLEIRSNEEKIAKYETERQQSKEEVLRGTLEELKNEAGLTDVTGPGITLSIAPAFNLIVEGGNPPSISPYMLKRLLNELNMYGAQHVSVDGERVINTTVIRDINRETKINGHSLNRFPVEIKIIVENAQIAEKLYNRMKVSTVADDFFIDNLEVKVNRPKNDIVIPAYADSIRIRYMESVKTDKGGGNG
ncbi:MAG TPA: NgoFVII family restriction endonuclease [Bacillus bacterium]|nr:NgoFVII family restriction endonuclease [Bacillus sp. (in: firmicutes)]